MNFGEKLSNLRKQKGLSQEELAEKLNITKKTVSDWENNKSRPGDDKIKEISDLLAVSVENLTNDQMKIEMPKNEIQEDFKPRSWLLIVLIVIAIIISIVLINKVVTDRKEAKDKNSIFNVIDGVDKRISNASFNNKFELYKGTEYGSSVSRLIDEIVTNNNKNKDQQIKVIYGETVTTDPNIIKGLKKNFDTWDKLEVTFDYDDNGFINQATIEKYETDEELIPSNGTSNNGTSNNGGNNTNNNGISDQINNNALEAEKRSFNSMATFHSGSKSGFFVKSMIDYVITNNGSNNGHSLYVSYNGTSVSDTSGLTSLKDKFSDFTNYEVTVSYGDDGYANGFSVK